MTIRNRVYPSDIQLNSVPIKPVLYRGTTKWQERNSFVCARFCRVLTFIPSSGCYVVNATEIIALRIPHI